MLADIGHMTNRTIIFQKATPYVIMLTTVGTAYNLNTLFRLNDSYMPITFEIYGNLYSLDGSSGFGTYYTKIVHDFAQNDRLQFLGTLNEGGGYFAQIYIPI